MLQKLIEEGKIPSLNEKPTTVIYHDPCRDGFAAQYILWEAMTEEQRKVSEFLPGQHGRPIPTVGSDRHIILVDIYYTWDDLLTLGRPGNTVTVLDHHKSAMEEVTMLFSTAKQQNGILFHEVESKAKKYNVYFDMNKSGTGLAWEYVKHHADAPMPDALRAVEKRDLWKHGNDEDKIILALDTYPKTNESWSEVIAKSQQGEINLLEMGNTLVGYRNSLINWDLRNVTWRTVNWDLRNVTWRTVKESSIEKYTVPALNTAQFSSEIGNLLCEKFPNAKFSLTWHRTSGDEVKLSFRSIGDFDVSIVAESFGGGGHKNASGALISVNEFEECIAVPSWQELESVLVKQPITID